MYSNLDQDQEQKPYDYSFKGNLSKFKYNKKLFWLEMLLLVRQV